jgi:hypothetical protein
VDWVLAIIGAIGVIAALGELSYLVIDGYITERREEQEDKESAKLLMHLFSEES